jgi:hypothetical protein
MDKALLLAAAVADVKKQVADLQNKASEIQKLEGPSGPKGDKGDQGPKGEQGDRGFDGRDGKDGRDGVDGKDGADGKNGVSVVDAEVAADGSLVFRMSDGNEIDAGALPSIGGNNESSVLVQQYSGPRIYVQADAPTGAAIGDIWFDIS